MPILMVLKRVMRRRSLPLVLAGLLLCGVAVPASAQFFPFFGGGQQQYRRPPPPRGGGWFDGDSFFRPFRRDAPPPSRAPVTRREDYSHAPPPQKREEPAQRTVLVLGDAMADWLGYGLEDALSETPDLGVTRKIKTISGLLSYQPKGEPATWAAAAREILATEKPDVIVVMLGLQDRKSIHETAADRKAEKDAHSKSDAKAADTKSADAAKAASAADRKDQDAEADEDDAAQDEADDGGQSGTVKFREERWGDIYTRKIDEMIRVLKTKGVPVLWVGLPAVRGTKSTSDMSYLDSLYRDAAGRADITYVDVWDGFVDEGGRYMQTGPDFEGQTRRLRSYDGVFFTKAGARKLAHYVEREITRVLANRSAPIEIPAESGTPEANAKPEGPAARPIAGPVLPLVASSVGTDQLLGGPSSRSAHVDPLTARTLVNGDPLSAPAGRADDHAWPRREVAHERAGDPVVAAVKPAEPDKAVAEKPKPRRHIVRPVEQARTVYNDRQRRVYAPQPRQYLPPPPGPADWLSRLFR
jgi:hypothetical protein